MKTCKRCQKLKSKTEFNKQSARKDGLHIYCRTCISEYAKNWRTGNPEKAAAFSRKYYEAHPDRAVKAALKWQSKNKEKARAITKQWMVENYSKVLEASERWRLRNPGLVRAFKVERKANELRAISKWADLQKVKEFYKLAKRLTEQTGIIHQVDHIVPLKSELVCGLHWEGNLQVIPAFENNSKGNRYWPDMP